MLLENRRDVFVRRLDLHSLEIPHGIFKLHRLDEVLVENEASQLVFGLAAGYLGMNTRHGVRIVALAQQVFHFILQVPQLDGEAEVESVTVDAIFWV